MHLIIQATNYFQLPGEARGPVERISQWITVNKMEWPSAQSIAAKVDFLLNKSKQYEYKNPGPNSPRLVEDPRRRFLEKWKCWGWSVKLLLRKRRAFQTKFKPNDPLSIDSSCPNIHINSEPVHTKLLWKYLIIPNFLNQLANIFHSLIY